jgi:hypothetical protein
VKHTSVHADDPEALPASAEPTASPQNKHSGANTVETNTGAPMFALVVAGVARRGWFAFDSVAKPTLSLGVSRLCCIAVTGDAGEA